ncbi:MAG: NADH-quinone oxidoreductase subunit NuoE [Steroidobacteraceae bacterium]
MPPEPASAAEGRLSAEERRELAQLTQRYENRRAASIEALRLVQRRHRWISDERLAEIAGLLGMTPDELEGIATFYNLIFRRPVGRHVILLCDSISCWVMGRDALFDHLRRTLGVADAGTTPDGRFTLLPIVCLGHCDHAPAMMVDGDLHGDLDASCIEALLRAYP